MVNQAQIHTVRVFVDTDKNYGSPLGIVMDKDQALSAEERQKIAADLNYSETVFIDDAKRGHINVFSPIRECPFSMYAAVGTAWYLQNIQHVHCDQLISHGQHIDVLLQNEKNWITSPISILPKWNITEYKTVTEIESLSVSTFKDKEHVLVWAWINKERGLVRARTFATDWGIPEDEANGSGSMRLAALLQRDITIIHGKGSLIFAQTTNKTDVRVGGFCTIVGDSMIQ